MLRDFSTRVALCFSCIAFLSRTGRAFGKWTKLEEFRGHA